MKNLKYIYLVINENINSGLITSQVIKPIDSLQDSSVTILNIHKLGNKNKSVQQSIDIPIAIPYRLFLFNVLFFLTPVIAFMYASILSLFISKNTIIISRSYFPSLVSMILFRLKGVKYIFDTRSLFIDESTLNGTIKVDSTNYKMWRYFEKKILCNSYKTTAVSFKQKEYYKSVCEDVKIELIPCYIMPIKKISNIEEIELRGNLNFSKNDIVICYYGSLDNGWNNIDMYCKFFNECLDLKYKILIVSQNYNRLIHDSRLMKNGISLLNTNGLTNEELLCYLQTADYGVVLMKKAADWETRLSVKFVEYLNIGLQVIVGEYVGEAKRYAKTYFKDRTIIYHSEIDIKNLISKTSYDRKNIDQLFGYSNLNKIIEV